jgi:SAM-dependent methyltransferase
MLGYVERSESAGGADYTHALMRQARWKRILDVQAPYRWNIRRLLGNREVLDLGCGVGRNLAHLAPNSVGVDHNEHSVQVCRERRLIAFTNAEFGATEHARPGRFGGMLVAHVIEHMTRAEAVQLLAGYMQYLASGARIVLICPQERGFGPQENGFAPHGGGVTSGQMAHVEFADFDALADICTRLGLAVSKRSSFPFPRSVGKVFAYNEFVVVATKPEHAGSPAMDPSKSG